MARIRYDEQTAAAFKAVREVPRDGLAEWRDAIARHLRAAPGMTLLDIGAGTGAFAAALSDWFGIDVLAVEPSAPMREQIPRLPRIQVFEGSAGALPLPIHPQMRPGCPWCFITFLTSRSPRRRSVASSDPVLPSSFDRASLGDATGSNSSDGSLRPLGRSVPILLSKRRARPSPPQDFTRKRLSRFARRTRPASPTSLARWTRFAAPTPRCATSPRTNSCVGRNVSAVLCSGPTAQGTRTAEPIGSTSWCSVELAGTADRGVEQHRAAHTDYPSEIARQRVTRGVAWRPCVGVDS
jgi:SAM-dependent methyltransferase